MTDKTTQKRRNATKTLTKKRRIPSPLLLFLLVLSLAVFFLLPQGKQQNESFEKVKRTVQKTVATIETSLKNIADPAPQKSKETEAPPDTSAENSIAQEQELEHLPVTLHTDGEKQAAAIINDFFLHLDNAEYIKSLPLNGSSREHFSGLIQKLLNNPPIVVRETDDLYTLLTNTAHFFRILGKKNVLLLKGMLHNEKKPLEEVLQALLVLSENKKELEQVLDITFNDRALYDYAAFFIDTVGGRLYLFRRDSSSRMVVTYYAIQILDRANSRHDSPYGIDIRPAINSLVEEMENGGNNLKFRSKYLENLYQLQKKYGQTDGKK